MGDRSTRRSRTAARRAAALLIAVAPVLLTAEASAGQDPGPGAAPVAYEVRAAADGLRVTLRLVPSILMPELVDLGAASAQAVLDSLGNSTAFAAAPYPGDLVLRGPALLLPTYGLPPDLVPPYPAVVEAEHPTLPSSSLEVPGYQLRADSGELASSASAVLGVDTDDLAALSVAATASAELRDDGAAAAHGEVRIDGLRLGPARVAGVTSSATAVARDADDVELDSTFAVHLVTGLGLDLLIDEDGIVLAGQRLPLSLLDLPSVTSLLGLDGVDLEVLPAEAGDGAVRSAGLRLRTRTVLADGIPSVLPAGTTVTVEVVLGQVTAAAGSVAARPVAPDATVPAPDAGPGASSSADGARAAPAGSAAGSAGSGGLRTVVTTSTRLERWSVLGPYLLVVAGGLGLLWAGSRFRTRGAIR